MAGLFQSFEVAVDLAERQRDGARQALQNVLQARVAAQNQMDQLQAYVQETQQRWGVQTGGEIKPEVMGHFYAFTAKLEHAIGVQAGVIKGQEQRVQQAQQVLLQAELRLTSLRKLLQNKRDEWARQQQRREQKQTDESASLRLSAARREQRLAQEREQE